MKREVYLAIPSWESLYKSGKSEQAFSITIFEWDHPYLEREIVGDEIFIRCDKQGERKQLRRTLSYVYGFETRTVVVNLR